MAKVGSLLNNGPKTKNCKNAEKEHESAKLWKRTDLEVVGLAHVAGPLQR